MPKDELIRELAARAWQQALQEKSREFADEVARRITSALPQQAEPSAPTRHLRDGALQISNSKSQTEVLEALLAACSRVVASCGLLILRGGQASGWMCVGLSSTEDFRRANLDCSRGVVASILSASVGRCIRAADFLDSAFSSLLEFDAATELLIVPMMVKERPAAILLARSGSAEDLAAMELLVHIAQLSLELQAYRKPGAVTSQPEPQMSQSKAAADSESAVYAMPQSREAASSQVVEQPAQLAGASTPVMPAADEMHERGRRFAKLLVEEIKLYNQTKVTEGRAHRDLYRRLREEIEKSRAAYQKRYGESVKDVDYFTQELMRILADNDPRLMGAGFPG